MKFNKFFKIVVIVASVMFIINLLFPGFWTIKPIIPETKVEQIEYATDTCEVFSGEAIEYLP